MHTAIAGFVNFTICYASNRFSQLCMNVLTTWTLTVEVFRQVSESFESVCVYSGSCMNCVQLSATDTTSSSLSQNVQQSDRYHEDGPLAGICPYVVTSYLDVCPVPLVVSPSLPAAVDLSVSYADDLPLNLSVTTTAAIQRLFQTASDEPALLACYRRQFDAGHLEAGEGLNQPPPPAHCHVTGRGGLYCVVCS